MKILVTGKNGQVGFEINQKLSSLGDIIAIDRENLDLTNQDNISQFLDQTKPNLIIHPAAYTAVDHAETESDLCYAVNVNASQALTNKAIEFDIPIIYFSTDYVFDGLKKEPYLEDDKVNPQSIYAKTKCEGETALRQHKKHIILRTGWVFGIHGNNFLKTILSLAQKKDSLNVIGDQRGSPTSASMLADITFKIVQNILNDKDFQDFGTYHLTSEGETSWYEYACFIIDEAIKLGFHSNITSSQIKAIQTDAYPTAAMRPLNSKLCCEKIKKTFMLELPSWKDEVTKVLEELIQINDKPN
jgi:dTDP-4-dehydrorhamnose reductase